MRRNLCCFIFFFVPFIIFSNGSSPAICDADGNEYFLGMSPNAIRNILGEPSEIYIQHFLPEKPEFDEIYWEYDSGIVFSFYRGEAEIRRIVFWEDRYLIKGNLQLFSPIHTPTTALPKFFRDGKRINCQEYFFIEFSYRKRDNHPFRRDMLQLYFKDNLCFKVCLIDDSEFL